MSLLKDVCSLPTAPFAETHVTRYLEQFVADRPRLRLTKDRWGNRLIQLPGRGARAADAPRLVFTAHTDHPGLRAGAMRNRTTLDATFHGGVLIEYVRGATVLFFDDAGRATRGRVATVKPADDDLRRAYPGACTVKVEGPVAPGSPGMFDLGTARTRGKTFQSRVLDDLAGLAAALETLDRLHKAPPAATVALLATRAEEEGFIGAMAASLRPELLRPTDRLIAIECSAAQPYAPQGQGVVIRVGDRTSVFDSALTYFLTDQAQALAKEDEAFRHQRLMPGGTCEATVYDLYGFTAAAVCIPLGNYHNMDRAAKRLAPETIHLSDWQNMVDLFVRTAKNAHRFDPTNKPLRARLEKRFNRFRPLLGR